MSDMMMRQRSAEKRESRAIPKKAPVGRFSLRLLQQRTAMACMPGPASRDMRADERSAAIYLRRASFSREVLHATPGI